MNGVGPRVRHTYDNGAPAHYVAGLGRGAIGFTTRSDIGPAQMASAIPGPPPGYIPGAGRGMGEAGGMLPNEASNGFGKAKDPNEDYGDYSETNYDEFSGYSGGLFNDTPYDKEDQEADQIYSNIDERMDSRRKRRREMKIQEDMKKARQDRPKISDQFSDLKSSLSKISDAEWESIPEIGDYSLKYKASQKKQDRFTPVPDSLIDGARQIGASVNALDPRQQNSGLQTPMYGGETSITGLAETRGTVLSLKLDKMSDSISGQTVVDPKGYLTDLNSLKITSDAEVGDIKKARLLLKSVTTTNPKHGPGWIAAARLEEVAGKLVQARKIINQGCEHCPTNEDVWLEATRLQNPENAKTVLANAIRNIKTSVKIWMHAAQLENEDTKKKLVLRKAIEYVPNSVKLWKAAIELEDPEGACLMLGRAVECVPQAVDLWLALARLENYDDAKKTLNKARTTIPTEPAIWITAAKLEEAQKGQSSNVERIIQAAVKSLSNHQVVIDREQWIREAEACERADAPLTCAAIIQSCLDINVEAEDRKRTWVDDAENCINRKSLQTAKAIYAHALKVFPGKKSIWLRAAALEKDVGDTESFKELLQKAVSYCPQAEILWLMAAKELWNKGDVDEARSILRQAFSANPNSENIWLAAVKIEWENSEFSRARALLAKARSQAPSARVWMKSILLERELEATENEEILIKEGLELYSDYPKLYMIAAQFYQEAGDVEVARKRFREGIHHCPKSVILWILSAKLEEGVVGVTKARSLLELARLKNPKSPELWLEAARLESRCGNDKGQEVLMAKALQECPDSGILLAESIRIAPRKQQRALSLAALTKKDNDPHVCLAVAHLFWNDRKYSKTRKWFERTVKLDPDFGDGWAFYYKFELAHGTEEQQNDIMKRCIENEPRHGEEWCKISKQTQYRRLKHDKLLKLVVVSLK